MRNSPTNPSTASSGIEAGEQGQLLVSNLRPSREDRHRGTHEASRAPGVDFGQPGKRGRCGSNNARVPRRHLRSRKEARGWEKKSLQIWHSVPPCPLTVLLTVTFRNFLFPLVQFRVSMDRKDTRVKGLATNQRFIDRAASKAHLRHFDRRS
jgi:hypothetical protein